MFKWKGQTTPDERSCFIKVPPLGAREIQTYALCVRSIAMPFFGDREIQIYALCAQADDD